MIHETNALIDIIENFNENYNDEIINEYPTNFSNDTLLIIKEVKKIAIDNNNDIFKKIYADFLTSVLAHAEVLKEHFSFDFNTVKTIDLLATNNEIESVEPSFVHYSFEEVEGIIEQMFDELKNIKESQDVIKEELEDILEDYMYHIEYIVENMQYNYYIYDGVEIPENETAFEAKIEAIKEDKMKLYEKYSNKLNARK